MEKVSAVIFSTSRPSRVFTVKASSEREKSCSFIMSVVGYSAMKGGKTARGAGTGGNWTAAIVYGSKRCAHSSKQHKEWVWNGYSGTTDDRGVKRSGFLIRFNEMAESA
jgi:hypothetical protein